MFDPLVFHHASSTVDLPEAARLSKATNAGLPSFVELEEQDLGSVALVDLGALVDVDQPVVDVRVADVAAVDRKADLSDCPPTEKPQHQRIRRPGAGRKLLTEKDPALSGDLDALVDPATRRDPESPLRWTSKSKAKLAEELIAGGHRVSAAKVGGLLHEMGYSLQPTSSRVAATKGQARDNAMFANTQMMGIDIGFPDVCLTPVGPAVAPIPYPNIAMGPMGVPAAYNVLFMCPPAHNLATMIPTTNGDNAGGATGVASGTVMGPARHLTGAFTVLVGHARDAADERVAA
jgi:hypothetical protein